MDKKIKIVLLIDVLNDIAGGAERQVYELIKRLNKDRFEVNLFVLHHKEIPREIKGLGIKAKGLGIRRIYSISGLIEGFKFAKFLKNEDADILMTYHFGSDIWGTAFGRLAGVSVIISNRRDEGFWRRAVHTSAYRFINRWVTKIIVVSNSVKATILSKEKVSEDKICIIYNGVELGRFNREIDITSKKKELGLPLNSRVIVCTGNLRPVKGHRYLMDASSDIIARFPDTHFIFIGDGGLRVEFEKLAQELGLYHNLHFLGKRDDVPELLNLSDICVLPSLSEGFSNAALEYMACGKAVVATKAGGNPELIADEACGILVDAADSKQLSGAIIALLADPERCKFLGKNALSKVERQFTLSKMIKEYEALFCEAAEKNIRVLHLISSNGLYGAEKVLLELASGMNSNGASVWLVGVRNLHNPHLEIIDEARKRGIPAGVVESNARFDARTVNQLVRFIRENRINLIHTHNYKSDFIGMSAARRTNIAIVATNHLWTRASFKLRLYEFFDGLILRRFNKVIAVSNQVKQDMLKAGIKETKIRVINNGIAVKPTDVLKNGLRNKLGIPEDATVVSCIARLSPEKGHTYLLEAAKKIIEKRADVFFVLVGDGPLRDALIKEAERLKINKRVIFAGYQKKIEDFYSITDIFVLPSLREGLPLAILEAMGFAKPVIATAVGASPEIINDFKTGILVKPANTDELYEALNKLLGDISLRDKLGENAKIFVRENYSVEKMVSAYKEVYEEVVG